MKVVVSVGIFVLSPAGLQRHRHKELKSERELYNGKQVVLFLKGNDLQPVSLSEYIHVISSPDTLVDIEKALGNTD